MVRGYNVLVGEGFIGETGLKRWRQENSPNDRMRAFIAGGKCKASRPGNEQLWLVSAKRSKASTVRREPALEPERRASGPITAWIQQPSKPHPSSFRA